jgi:hypothetical protein
MGWAGVEAEWAVTRVILAQQEIHPVYGKPDLPVKPPDFFLPNHHTYFRCWASVSLSIRIPKSLTPHQLTT